MRNLSMNAVCIIASLLFFVLIVPAQKELPDKQKTIEYLDKKLKETVGFSRKPTGEKAYRFFVNRIASLDSESGFVTFWSKSTRNWASEPAPNTCEYEEYYVSAVFNPAFITDVVSDPDPPASEGLSSILVKFSSKSVKTSFVGHYYSRYGQGDYSGKCYDWKKSPENNEASDKLTVSYLKGDSSNFEKIKKALLHLRDLTKADDDPFAD